MSHGVSRTMAAGASSGLLRTDLLLGQNIASGERGLGFLTRFEFDIEALAWPCHMWTSDNRGRRLIRPIVPRSGRRGSVIRTIGGSLMTRFVGLDVSQKITAICVVDDVGRRLWRGQCSTNPEQINILVRRHAGSDARIGIETGAMTPWLVHELRNLGLEVVCLDARHARAALEMQINKTDQNDAEGLAQIVRTGWYRSVHVKSFESHRARALLGARAQLIGMTTRLSNHIRGVLKTFGLLPDAMRGLPFDRKVEALILDRSDVALIVRPMLLAWRQVREQIAVFDKAIRVLVRSNSACRLLMSVPGIGVLSALAYVSTVEDPGRFSRSRSVGAHLGLTPRQYQSGEVDRSGRISKCGDTLARTLLYEAAVVILTRVKKASSLKDWWHAIARRSGNGKARVAVVRKLSVILHSVWRSGQPFRGRSTQTPPDSIVHKIHPSEIADVMVARRAKVGLERRHCMPARCGHCSTCASDPRREP